MKQLLRAGMIAGLLIGCAGSLRAQTAAVVPGGPANIAGGLYASNFAGWTVPQGNNGPLSWSFSVCTGVTTGGVTFKPFVVGNVVRIVDVNPALSETVTVTAVNSIGSGCSINVHQVNQHTSFYLTTATAGLQEALNYAGNNSYVVYVTPDFMRLGGMTSTITSVKGNTSVAIQDVRTVPMVCYAWNGTAYASTTCGSGGGGTPAGLNCNFQFNLSGSFGGSPSLCTDTTTNVLQMAGQDPQATFLTTGGTYQAVPADGRNINFQNIPLNFIWPGVDGGAGDVGNLTGLNYYPTSWSSGLTSAFSIACNKFAISDLNCFNGYHETKGGFLLVDDEGGTFFRDYVNPSGEPVMSGTVNSATVNSFGQLQMSVACTTSCPALGVGQPLENASTRIAATFVSQVQTSYAFGQTNLITFSGATLPVDVRGTVVTEVDVPRQQPVNIPVMRTIALTGLNAAIPAGAWLTTGSGPNSSGSGRGRVDRTVVASVVTAYNAGAGTETITAYIYHILAAGSVVYGSTSPSSMAGGSLELSNYTPQMAGVPNVFQILGCPAVTVGDTTTHQCEVTFAIHGSLTFLPASATLGTMNLYQSATVVDSGNSCTFANTGTGKTGSNPDKCPYGGSQTGTLTFTVQAAPAIFGAGDTVDNYSVAAWFNTGYKQTLHFSNIFGTTFGDWDEIDYGTLPGNPGNNAAHHLNIGWLTNSGQTTVSQGNTATGVALSAATYNLNSFAVGDAFTNFVEGGWKQNNTFSCGPTYICTGSLGFVPNSLLTYQDVFEDLQGNGMRAERWYPFTGYMSFLNFPIVQVPSLFAGTPRQAPFTTTATGTSGASTITVASATGIVAGMAVGGGNSGVAGNIGAGALVASSYTPGSTTVPLTAANAGAITGAVSFTPMMTPGLADQFYAPNVLVGVTNNADTVGVTSVFGSAGGNMQFGWLNTTTSASNAIPAGTLRMRFAVSTDNTVQTCVGNVAGNPALGSCVSENTIAGFGGNSADANFIGNTFLGHAAGGGGAFTQFDASGNEYKPSIANTNCLAIDNTATHQVIGQGCGLNNPMTTVGDIIYGGTATGGVAAPMRLAAGTSTFVLTSNGPGTAPSWQVVGGGSMVYPGAGIANSTGTAWGTSYTTSGTGTVVALANGASLTNIPVFTYQSSTGHTTAFLSDTGFLFSGIGIANNTLSVATSFVNVASPIFNLGGSVWQGSGAAVNNWQLQGLIATGTNAATTLDITQNGSTGVAAVRVPNFIDLGVTGSTQCAEFTTTGQLQGTGSACGTSSGGITNIATTGPISGGPITATGTISCPTCAVTGSPLSQFAATTSAQLASVISDETGSGALVFGTSPVLVTPNLGTPTALVLTSATGLPLTTGVTGNLPNANLATQTANTVLGALTTTNPSGLAMPSCSGATNALTWTSGAGFGCNTISSGSSAFSALTSGTNTSAAMVVGAGASLDFTSTGTINASTLGGHSTGTSGATLCLLNTACTFTGATYSFGSASVSTTTTFFPATTEPVVLNIDGGNFFPAFNTTAAGLNLTSSSGKLTIGSNSTSTVPFSGPRYLTTTNCAAAGTSASPSVAACGSAAAGHISCAVAASAATCTVTDTAVTATSEIMIQLVSSPTVGTALGVTCNTLPTAIPLSFGPTSQTAGTGFSFTNATVLTNPACYQFSIIN